MKPKNLSRREFLKGAMGVGVGAMMLSACAPAAAPAPEPAKPAEKAPEPTKAPPPAAKVSLVYWAEPRFQNVKGKEEQTKEIGDYERLLVKGFTDSNSNVTVQTEALKWEDLATKVAAAIAAGTPPDLLKDYLGRTSKYANESLLEALEGAIPKDEYSDYLESLVTLYTIKGHMHGLPVYFWVTCYGGNRATFKEAKAEDKLPNADGVYPLGKFEEALKALAVKDKRWPIAMQVASEQGDYGNLGYFWANGAKLFKDGNYSKTTFNSPEAVETLKKLVNWYKAGYIIPGVTTISGSDLNNMLFMGQSVLGITGPGFVPLYEVAKKEGKQVAAWEPFYSLFPGKDGQKSGGLAAGPTALVIFKQKDDAKRKAAVDVARHLAAPDKQTEYCVVSKQYPTRKSTGNPFKDDKDLTTILDWSQKWGVEDMGLSSLAYAEVRVKLPPELQAAFLGKKTPEQALADYEKAANEVLAKYAGK